MSESDFIKLYEEASYTRMAPSLFNLSSSNDELLRYFLRVISESSETVPMQGVSILRDAYVSDVTMIFDSSRNIIEQSIVDHAQSLSFEQLMSYDNEVDRIEGDASFIFKAGKDNYGHFLVEMLPKIELLLDAGLHGTRIIVPTLPSQLRGILDFIINQVYSSRFDIINMKHSITSVEKLLYPSAVTRHNKQKSQAVLNFADKVLRFVPPRADFGERIYVSRRKFTNRILQEENEIEYIFQNYGFDVIYVEELPFQDQVSAFRGAKFIAGPMGAGLTSTLFSTAGAHIIMIDPGTHDFFFYDLACLKKQPFSWIFGQPLKTTDNENLHGGWSVRPDIVQSALRSIFGR